MFHSTDFDSTFARLRFDFESQPAPLASAPLATGASASPPGEEGLRFGLPADSLLEEMLCARPLPSGLLQRLHTEVDSWPDNSAA